MFVKKNKIRKEIREKMLLFAKVLKINVSKIKLYNTKKKNKCQQFESLYLNSKRKCKQKLENFN